MPSGIRTADGTILTRSCRGEASLESEAYAHALICDLLSSPVAEPFEAGAETGVTGGQIADGIRLWLMLQKETQKWDGDPAFVDALNSVLARLGRHSFHEGRVVDEELYCSF